MEVKQWRQGPQVTMVQVKQQASSLHSTVVGCAESVERNKYEWMQHPQCLIKVNCDGGLE